MHAVSPLLHLLHTTTNTPPRPPAPPTPQLNERLSLGQHRVWKRMAVRWAGAGPGDAALDVCCGSGDLAFELARAVGPSGSVTGLDFAAEMLEDAESRRRRQEAARPASRPAARMTWVQGDALDLPFADGSFAAATIGYGLRNVADVPRALRELLRVLRPGASVAVLDFNNSEDPLVDGVQVRFLCVGCGFVVWIAFCGRACGLVLVCFCF